MRGAVVALFSQGRGRPVRDGAPASFAAMIVRTAEGSALMTMTGIFPATSPVMLASGRSFAFGSPDTLASLYRNAGVTPDREVITYCGRGYAGACGLLALKLLGYERARLYDGSWAEWSADPSLPVEVSPP